MLPHVLDQVPVRIPDVDAPQLCLRTSPVNNTATLKDLNTGLAESASHLVDLVLYQETQVPGPRLDTLRLRLELLAADVEVDLLLPKDQRVPLLSLGRERRVPHPEHGLVELDGGLEVLDCEDQVVERLGSRYARHLAVGGRALPGVGYK